MPKRCNLRAQKLLVSQVTIHWSWLIQFYCSDQPIQTWFCGYSQILTEKKSGYRRVFFVLHVCKIVGRNWAWIRVNERERTSHSVKGPCIGGADILTCLKVSAMHTFFWMKALWNIWEFKKRICVPIKNSAGHLADEIRWVFLIWPLWTKLRNNRAKELGVRNSAVWLCASKCASALWGVLCVWGARI